MYSTYHLQLMTAKTFVTCQSVARSERKLNNGDAAHPIIWIISVLFSGSLINLE